MAELAALRAEQDRLNREYFESLRRKKAGALPAPKVAYDVWYLQPHLYATATVRYDCSIHESFGVGMTMYFDPYADREFPVHFGS